MLTWTARWHRVQAELNMKPQRTKLPSSTDTSCSSVAGSSAVSTKNPEANPDRSRDRRTYLHQRWHMTEVSNNYYLTLQSSCPPVLDPIPQLGALTAYIVTYRLSPRSEHWNQRTAWKINLICLHTCCFLLWKNQSKHTWVAWSPMSGMPASDSRPRHGAPVPCCCSSPLLSVSDVSGWATSTSIGVQCPFPCSEPSFSLLSLLPGVLVMTPNFLVLFPFWAALSPGSGLGLALGSQLLLLLPLEGGRGALRLMRRNMIR